MSHVLNHFAILKFFERGFNGLLKYSNEKVDLMGAPYGWFVPFAVINSCILPFIFSQKSDSQYNDFIIYFLTLSLSFASLLLIKDFWPKALIKYFPLYWHFTLFFCLPYSAITMCLFSSCSINWVIDVILTTFILGVLVDWISYIVMILFGAFFSVLSFLIFADISELDFNYGNFPIMFYATTVALLVGAIFSRSKEVILMEKLNTLKALGATIAHEMRTPLSSINLSASGLNQCLPILVQSYETARFAGIKLPNISKIVLDSAANAPERMQYICVSALNTIDMIIRQLNDNNWYEHYSKLSIKDCILTAINDYAFRKNEIKIINIDNIVDYNFLGHKDLVIHIIHNLMKNALTFIQSEKKGAITIWTVDNKNNFELHFRDTAKGINKKDLPRIFEHGFSKKSGGTGIGLYYCKKMMHAMDGDIHVISKEGVYCEFVCTFRKI